MFDAREHDVHRACLFQEAPMSVPDWPGGRIVGRYICQKLEWASMSGTGDKFMRNRKGPGHPKSRARVDSVKPQRVDSICWQAPTPGETNLSYVLA